MGGQTYKGEGFIIMMDFLRLIESKGYITVSKELARNIGLDETMILTELISKYNYWKDKKELTEKGYFYITIKNLKHETTLTKYRQTKAINNLKEMGLIKTKKQGLPARRYFTICEDKIKKLFFAPDKHSDHPRNDQEVKNSKTSNIKNRKLKVKNLTQLRNNNNKTEEEDIKIPQKIQLKFQQIFNRELSVEFYNKITEIYPESNIILKALSVCEQQADKPKYLLIMLQDWQDNGLKSVSSINTYLENRQANKAAKHSKKETTATRPETPEEELQMLYEEGYR